MTDANSAASTRTSRVIKAPREALYRAFTDPAALAVWLAPGEMTAKVHAFATLLRTSRFCPHAYRTVVWHSRQNLRYAYGWLSRPSTEARTRCHANMATPTI
jgi:uncharacterized protein YndB with AHSA1/START domain